jgi:hypothetical protein
MTIRWLGDLHGLHDHRQFFALSLCDQQGDRLTSSFGYSLTMNRTNDYIESDTRLSTSTSARTLPVSAAT